MGFGGLFCNLGKTSPDGEMAMMNSVPTELGRLDPLGHRFRRCVQRRNLYCNQPRKRIRLSRDLSALVTHKNTHNLIHDFFPLQETDCY